MLLFSASAHLSVVFSRATLLSTSAVIRHRFIVQSSKHCAGIATDTAAAVMSLRTAPHNVPHCASPKSFIATHPAVTAVHARNPESGGFCTRATAPVASEGGPPLDVPEGQMAVFEYIMTFRLRDSSTEQQGLAALEALWSLQFRLPGCLYAAGGAVDPSLGHANGAVSHMLHMRFDSLAEAQAFRQHDVVGEVFRVEIEPYAEDVTEIILQVCIEKNLAAIFRKGSEWETGVEHLLVTTPLQGAANSSLPHAFLERLAQLARQPPAGALQVCVGPVIWHNGPATLQVAANWGFLARFPTAAQLRGLRESLPYAAAVAGDERVPVMGLSSVTFELLSAEQQQSRAAPLNVTDV